MASSVPYSVLDLSPIVAGGSASQAFRNSLDLARHAEKWDYNRYWLAKHHKSAEDIPGSGKPSERFRSTFAT